MDKNRVLELIEDTKEEYRESMDNGSITAGAMISIMEEILNTVKWKVENQEWI